MEPHAALTKPREKGPEGNPALFARVPADKIRAELVSASLNGEAANGRAKARVGGGNPRPPSHDSSE